MTFSFQNLMYYNNIKHFSNETSFESIYHLILEKIKVENIKYLDTFVPHGMLPPNRSNPPGKLLWL